MFRAILASGVVAWLGLVAPAQAQSQHYQPGFPLVYYHPVPAAPVYGIHRRHHGAYRQGYHAGESRYGQPAYGFRSVNRGGVYLEARHQPRAVRPAARFHVDEDRTAYAARPYGYAYRPRPNARNVYSSAYREDDGSWRTRREGIVVVHPRGPIIRPVSPTGDALVVPGRSGALVVTQPRDGQQVSTCMRVANPVSRQACECTIAFGGTASLLPSGQISWREPRGGGGIVALQRCKAVN